VIFCSRAERELVGATSAMVIQTLGPSGVQIDTGDRRVSLPVAANRHDLTRPVRATRSQAASSLLKWRGHARPNTQLRPVSPRPPPC
jgi:hypothetical protein